MRSGLMYLYTRFVVCMLRQLSTKSSVGSKYIPKGSLDTWGQLRVVLPKGPEQIGTKGLSHSITPAYSRILTARPTLIPQSHPRRLKALSSFRETPRTAPSRHPRKPPKLRSAGVQRFFLFLSLSLSLYIYIEFIYR